MRAQIPLAIVGFCIFASQIIAGSFEPSDYFTAPKEAALADAAKANNIKRIKELVADGVDVNARGRSNLTPLVMAASNNSKQAYECLLKLGADPNIQFQETGASALAVAAAMPESSYLEQALAHGGKVDQVNPITGLTPIWRSIQQMLPINVRLLAAAGANVNFADDRGVTPLMFAAGANRFDIDLILLDAGADPKLKNRWGNSLLWYIHHNRADPQSKNFEWRQQVVGRLQALGIDTDHGT
jgi:ankyrin repeat protein